MNENYTVYMHRFPNGKVYIGMTSKKPEDRWERGSGYRTQNVFKAILKYGWDNIEHIVLFDALSKDDAEKKEQNTVDILAYMESQKGIVCEILEKGLAALNSPDKLAEASPSQITTALGTLIDKWAMISGGPSDNGKEDELSKSLREMAEELESDE